jgi:hypothetical protein
MYRLPIMLLSIALLLHLSTAYGQTGDLEPIEVKYGEQVFEVQAAMPGDGNIGIIQVFPGYGSIFITLNGDPEVTEGELHIVLPRALIDSKTEDGSDTEFLILVDGEDLGYEEISTTAEKRELIIPIFSDSTEVEIFGSQVLPEFQFGFIVLAAVTAIGITTIAYQRAFKGKQLS